MYAQLSLFFFFFNQLYFVLYCLKSSIPPLGHNNKLSTNCSSVQTWSWSCATKRGNTRTTRWRNLSGGTVSTSVAITRKTCLCSQDAKYSVTTAETVKSNPDIAFIQKYSQLMCSVDHCIPSSSCLGEFCMVSHLPSILSVLYFKASVKAEKTTIRSSGRWWKSPTWLPERFYILMLFETPY